MTNDRDIRWPPNPFSPGRPLDAPWMVGRDAEMQKLGKAVVDVWPRLVVRGPRGMGKTTLVRALASRKESRAIHIDVRDHIDPRDVAKPGVAVRALAHALLAELPSYFNIRQELRPALATERELASILEDLCNDDAPVPIIILDEMDFLDPAAQRAVGQLANRRPGVSRSPLWIFVIGENWGGNSRVEPLASHVPEIALGLLSCESIAALLKRFPDENLFPFEPTTAEVIHAETAGHPLFLAAVLDDIYDRRHTSDDRSPVSRDDVRAAAQRIEIHPNERIRHALRQGGPAVERVLRTLAEPAREALSTQALLDIFKIEWPGWANEIIPTLEGLSASALLSSEAGIWSHRIPILRGYIGRIDREQIATGERPPRPDAWAAYCEAEELERRGESEAALNAYQRSADSDPDFWLAQWQEARLLAATANDENANTRLQQAKRKLAYVAQRAAAGTVTHAAVVADLCRTIVRLAESLPPSDATRRELLTELRHFDEHFTTPGAADRVAETMVAAWTHALNPPTETWVKQTRNLLHADAYVGSARVWRLMARWVTDKFDTRAATQGADGATLRDLFRFIVPVVLDERPFSEEPEPLWDAARSWLREHARDSSSVPDGPWLEPLAWNTLLRNASAGIADFLLQDFSPWLRHDFTLFLQSSASAQVEQLLGTLFDPQLGNTVGPTRIRKTSMMLWSSVEELVLELPDIAARQRILDSLGRTLRMFRNARAASDDEIENVITEFASRWPAKDEIHVPPSTIETWQAVAEKVAPDFVRRMRPTAHSTAADSLTDDERRQVREWLGDGYDVEERLPLRLPGYRPETLREVLRAYRAHPKNSDEKVLIRTFQLRNPNPAIERLMKSMWERERRALATLSLTPAGRALPRYREARWLENVAILVTDWPGSMTLREVMRTIAPKTLREQKGKANFWSQFILILHGVTSLHSNGFLHRTISPEAIYESDVTVDAADTWMYDPGKMTGILRLCHYEWSVYLRGLRSLGPYRAKELNRYIAPEALRAALSIDDRWSGETFASDLYSLGLTLFECLVRPFRGDDELESYKSDAAYGPVQQRAHREWLESLRQEAQTARRNGKIESFEENILAGLLHFEINRRTATLESIVKQVRDANARERYDAKKKLPVFAALRTRSGTGDPRRDVRSLAFFLSREVPQLDLVNNAADLSPASIARIVEDELRAATVFLNRDKTSPLLLQSRTGTYYRLKPFEVGGKQHARVAYLEVAQQYQGDEAIGEPIGMLRAGVEVRDAGNDKAAQWVDKYTERGWTDLFAMAARSTAWIDEDTLRRRDRRTLLDILGISLDIEYALSWKEAAFVRPEKGTTIVQSASRDENLAVVVSAWLARDVVIEIARPRDPAGTGHTVDLLSESLDIESGTIRLPGIDPDDIPEHGVLRPSGSRGVAALYRRRREVLRQVRDDSVLLDSIVSPSETVRELPHKLVGSASFALSRLDEEKQHIVENYRRIRPLVVVQGPPGTGKTTLATEVVLQTLLDDTNHRILVTAQGHAPLDNLLMRLLQEKDRNPTAQKALAETEIVRLKSGNRSDAEYPEEVRKYLPYERADRLFRMLRHETERRQNWLGLDGAVAKAMSAALQPYASAPTSLLRRIEDSANVVFVTTNAREVEGAVPGHYDVIIVEEAARCVPIELLAVMRLARQWLLIGDHQQLPPFGYELAINAVNRKLEGLVKDLDAKLAALTDGAGRRHREQIESESRRVELLQQAAPVYMQLFRHLHESTHDPRASATLRTQWRMHPRLGEMVSHVFYDDQAVVNPEGEHFDELVRRTTHQFRQPLDVRDRQLIWIDFDLESRNNACGERRGPGGQLENDAERRTAVAFLRLLQNGRQTHDIAILTPYRKQMEQLRNLMSEKENRFDAFGVVQDRIFTVDSFQGQQAATVVLSLVRNNAHAHVRSAVGFLAERQRATVMFSRAERLLVVLGCSAHFKRFEETRWVLDIFDRSVVIPWTQILPLSERTKLEQRWHA
jgi:serine/threonine protein kinase/type II secretory pathway predicted ATPase ExeA